MRILLVAEPMPAIEALRIGLVNDIVPREQLLERAFEFARKIIDNGPLAIRKIKESVLRSQGRPLEESVAIETECMKPEMRLRGGTRGTPRFDGKEKTKFTGR